jgi:hypothetical protein
LKTFSDFFVALPPVLSYACAQLLPKIYEQELEIPASDSRFGICFSLPHLSSLRGCWTGYFLSAKPGPFWDTTFRILQCLETRSSLSAAIHLAKALGGKYEANHLLGREPWDVSSLPVR